MKTTMKNSTIRLMLLGLILTAVVVYALVTVGCSDRVSGTRFQNQAPVVQFVNVPPDSLRVSRNPVVYWYGTDVDGQVKAFRYIVKSVDDLHGFTPAVFARDSLNGYDSTDFVYLTVSVTDPKTSNTVQMSADLDNPVNAYVPQYIFLQAFDDQWLSSTYVWKLILRNDNPPKSFISVTQGDTFVDPFINSVLSGGAITGVRIGWRGEDLIDYPSDPPPFQFRWKFFGPYEYDTATTNDEIDLLKSQFVKRVFISADGQVYYIGQHDTIFRCDTTFVPPNVVVSCDTILVDTIRADGALGSLDTRLMVDDPTFLASTYNRVVDSSPSWILTTRDTLFNVFRNNQDTATNQRVFILWVTCRDDAKVEDLAPAFKELYVIDPKFERDVLVVDFSKVSDGVRYNAPYRENRPAKTDTITDSAKAYWDNAIAKWNPSVDFSKKTDYYYTNAYQDALPLDVLLKYKLMILYNDNVTTSGITTDGRPSQMGRNIYTAIDAGINAFLTMRAPAYSKNNMLPSSLPFEPPLDVYYQSYFGVQSMVFTSWLSWLVYLSDTRPEPVRIEDFIGAYSLKPDKWPDLALDTALFHRRYRWQTYQNGLYVWTDSIAALPEVDWTSRSYGTEPMYLYKSRFGTRGHFLGNDYTFDGSPVAHRLDAGLFRTVHCNFTTPGMDTLQAQVFLDTVLNWLYDEYLTAPPTATRYPGAAAAKTIEQVRTMSEARRLEARQEAAWRHQDASGE
jgi:hypothetical protein